MQGKLRIDLLEKHYGTHKAPHTLYKETVQSYSFNGQKILDFGAGRGDSIWIYPAGEIQMYGVDVGLGIFQNPLLFEAKLLEEGNIPYDSEFFDLVMATWVLEHLSDPLRSFTELFRVMTKGAKFIFLTPNLFHYATTVARFSSYRFHKFFMNRFLGREEDEVFSTFYKANSPNQLHDLARKTGFSYVEIFMAEPPPLYLGFSYPTFYLGMGLERLLSTYEILSCFRQSIIGVFTK
jgi:SAM-dependent methyltransferase